MRRARERSPPGPTTSTTRPRARTRMPSTSEAATLVLKTGSTNQAGFAARSAIDVPMGHAGLEAPPPEQPADLLGDDHRAVASAGAAEGEGEVRLPLLHVGREEQLEQVVEPVEER